jgi:hypothetical protein
MLTAAPDATGGSRLSPSVEYPASARSMIGINHAAAQRLENQASQDDDFQS